MRLPLQPQKAKMLSAIQELFNRCGTAWKRVKSRPDPIPVFAKFMVWYVNEWGSCRVVDPARQMKDQWV
ncbi:MAG: hypothetical protein ACLFQR_11445 [Desulfovibrionales bacterium]